MRAGCRNTFFNLKNALMITLNAFPDGKQFALTMSYDDGVIHDERLISIFNKYGIKGTFHLNSGLMETPNRIRATDAVRIYKGHEIACHTVSHPFPDELLNGDLVHEILQDRINLEKITGGIVRGMSYPYGRFNDSIIATMAACGIVYSRTTLSHNKFNLPQQFLAWHPTCHHKNAEEPAERFLASLAGARNGRSSPSLFYIWGHSYEFEHEGNWDFIETLSAKMGGHDDVWYATNIEIADYDQARRAMQASADGRRVYNPSSIPVWVNVEGSPLEILPGATLEP